MLNDIYYRSETEVFAFTYIGQFIPRVCRVWAEMFMQTTETRYHPQLGQQLCSYHAQ